MAIGGGSFDGGSISAQAEPLEDWLGLITITTGSVLRGGDGSLQLDGG